MNLSVACSSAGVNFGILSGNSATCLEVGDFFYISGASSALTGATVTLHNCGMQFLIMDDLISAGRREERETGPDVDTALAAAWYCAKCDSEITGNILLSNYASEVMSNVDHFDGYEPIVLYDIKKLFLDFANEEYQE